MGGGGGSERGPEPGGGGGRAERVGGWLLKQWPRILVKVEAYSLVGEVRCRAAGRAAVSQHMSHYQGNWKDIAC